MHKLLARISYEIGDKIFKDGDRAGMLVLSIVRHAASLYELAGVEEDFYLCEVTNDRITFGHTNKIHWSAEYGFYIDPKQSSAQFREALAGEGVTA